MDNYSVDINSLHLNRRPGVSGFFRIRNEAEFLPQAIESHLDGVDEMVVVYNRCTDGTDRIVQEYADRFPDKIKAYCYEPEVYPQGSQEYLSLPPDSIHSLVNYYNFALSKTTRQTVFKIDGDDIAMRDKLRFVSERLHQTPLEDRVFLVTVGINLWRIGSNIYINGQDPFPGLDHGFFNVTPGVFYQKGEHCEFLGGELNIRYAGYLYYHAKGLKRDRGNTNYDLANNPNSYYQQLAKREPGENDLLTLEQLAERYPQSEELRYIPTPQNTVYLPEFPQ